MRGLNFNERPILVFWETTKACDLKCIHCRAEAIPDPLPGELDTDEGKSLIDELTEFGRPYPVLILTGGDPLKRQDLEELLSYAGKRGIKVGIAPAVTELLFKKLPILRKHNVRYVSISLDGMEDTHDRVRGIKGHFQMTLEALKTLKEGGWILQVNTLVAKETVKDLPELVKLLHDLQIGVWELFFLVKVGRGTKLEELTPEENEDVSHFLYEVSRYGIEIRTVEAPFFRRVYLVRKRDSLEDFEEVARTYNLGNLYMELTTRLRELLGEPEGFRELRSAHTRDGYGIIFVAYNGEVYPSGFAPFSLGNIKKDSLTRIYRENPILKKIRGAEFRGRCGVCEFKHVCGGSRARALSSGDILGEDPACSYTPKLSKKEAMWTARPRV